MSNVTGYVHVELTVSGDWRIENLTAGWSKKEIEQLAAGSPEAIQALKDLAAGLVRRTPDDAEVDVCDVRIEEGLS